MFVRCGDGEQGDELSTAVSNGGKVGDASTKAKEPLASVAMTVEVARR